MAEKTWTSSNDSSMENSAWVVDFFHGNSVGRNRDFHHGVRAVREPDIQASTPPSP